VKKPHKPMTKKMPMKTTKEDKDSWPPPRPAGKKMGMKK
jgi:hypothetical protein